MGNDKAKELIRKYLEGTATPEEEALLETWYMEAANNAPEMPGISDYPEHHPLPTIKPAIRLWPRVAVAASILIVLASASYFVLHKKPGRNIVRDQPPPAQKDILPAATKAMLTLVDGKTVVLDSARNGTVAQQGKIIARSVDGQLNYNGDGDVSGMNTLTTLPGEQYSVVLPDGTKVWLNTASSISYPVTFAGKERRVTVTGEAYFEIVHNARQPFRVAVKDQLVEDIGTHLNINAYDDEPVLQTTLLEGSVRVTKGAASAILKPGQQATIRPDNSSFDIKLIDTDEAMAWKNGYFYFDGADIQTVMRQLARWYDVQIVYKGDLPKRKFKGKVYRNINASEALKILSYFGAHFVIDGKTITVSA